MERLFPQQEAARHSSPSSLAGHELAMARLSCAIGSHRDPDSLFCVLVKELRAVVRSQAIGVVHYDEAEERLRWWALDIDGEPLNRTPGLCWEHSAFQWCWDSQSPLVTYPDDPQAPFAEALSFLVPFGVKSVCVLPLTTAHRRLGAMVFASSHVQSFCDSTVQELSGIVDRIAPAVDYVFSISALRQMRDRLESETARLKLMLRLGDSITSEAELQEFVAKISPSLRRLARVDAVALILPDVENGILRFHTLDVPEGFPLAPRAGDALPANSIAGRVFQSGRPWAGRLQTFRGGIAESPESNLRIICVLPLVRHQRVIGVLGLGRLQETAFSADEIDFLSQVARQIAIAVSDALPSGPGGAPVTNAAVRNGSITPFKSGRTLPIDAAGEFAFEDMIGNSPVLHRILRQVQVVAPAQTTVLIAGETGTGKELLARAIHNLSQQSGGPFVKVNCASLPSDLIESELFGHEKGAFTGALAQRIGRFELADRGTLFLDEVGELPAELQPKLLRVLQEHEFERLGSSRTLHTTARLVAATNRDLKSMVAEGRFRADLFYRLSVFPIQLPPLRERPEDIPVLVGHFTRHFARILRKNIDTIAAETMSALLRYPWPGNIRELQNIVERAVILSEGRLLEISLAELEWDEKNHAAVGESSALEEIERKHILSVLDQVGWVLAGPAGAAVRLGIKRSTLQFRMKKLGISRPAKYPEISPSGI